MFNFLGYSQYHPGKLHVESQSKLPHSPKTSSTQLRVQNPNPAIKIRSAKKTLPIDDSLSKENHLLPATVFWSCQIYILHIYLSLIVLYIFAHIPDLHTRRIMMNHVDLHDLRYNLSDAKKHGGFQSHGGTFPRNHSFSFWDFPCTVTKTIQLLGVAP